MGTVVAVIVTMAGIVITILIIIIYVLWRRYAYPHHNNIISIGHMIIVIIDVYRLGFSKAEKEQSLQHNKRCSFLSFHKL